MKDQLNPKNEEKLKVSEGKGNIIIRIKPLDSFLFKLEND